VLAFLLLLTAGPAAAQDGRPLPWAGGMSAETEFERYAAQVASEIAQRPVKVNCNGATDWTALATQQHFDPTLVWGYVMFYSNPATGELRPADYMHLSEQACWNLDQWWAAPSEKKGKMCRLATQIEYKTRTTKVRVTKRVKVNGRWRTKVSIVTQTQQVKVETPMNEICPNYMLRVFALQTVAHESMHLSGTLDEAQAECQGMQRLSWVAQRFGATAEQAQQIALDYYRDYYLALRPGTPYFVSGCPNPAG
jgi:hypothetical protein